MLRIKPAYAPTIRGAADVGVQALTLTEFDLAVLAAIECTSRPAVMG